MSRLGLIGVAGTIIYLCLIWYFQNPILPKLTGLGPSEFGDFIAGVFGPLATFWLVLGFFQQGKQIRNSAESLDLQAKELRASIEQQRVAVDEQRKAMERMGRRGSDWPNDGNETGTSV